MRQFIKYAALVIILILSLPLSGTVLLASSTTNQPTVPTGFKSKDTTATSVYLTWDNDNNSRYVITYGNVTQTTTKNSIMITGLNANTTYSFYIAGRIGSVDSATRRLNIRTKASDTNPAIPQNLNFSNIKDTSVNLTWDEALGATHYEIHGSGALVPTPIPNHGSHRVTGLTPDTEYTFKVRSRNAGKASGYSTTVKVRTAKSVSVPQNFRVTEITDSTVSMAWDNDPGATEYQLHGVGSIRTTSDTSYTYTDLLPGTEYRIRVRSRNQYVNSSYTPYINITTEIPVTPAIPENIKTTAISATTLSLQWDGAENAKKYVLKFNNNEYETNLPSYSLTGLLPDTTYEIQVKSINGTVESDYSSIINISTAPIPSAKELSHKVIGLDSADVSWKALDGALKYEVSVNGQITAQKEKTLSLTELDYNTDYIIKVRGKNGASFGSWAETTVNIPAPVVPAVQNLSAVQTHNRITITWDAVALADLYVISYMDKEVETKLTRYIITGLDENTLYEIKIIPKHRNVFGNESLIRVTTNPKPGSGGLYDEITLDVVKGQQYSISLDSSNITSKTNTFYLGYDPEELQLVDLAAQTRKKNTATGPIPDTDISVISIDNGVITFKANKEIPEGKVWSGILTVVEFNALKSGDASVLFYTNE